MSSITCSQLTKTTRLDARQSLSPPLRFCNGFLHLPTRRFRPGKKHPRGTSHNTTTTAATLLEAAEVIYRFSPNYLQAILSTLLYIITPIVFIFSFVGVSLCCIDNLPWSPRRRRSQFPSLPFWH
jgi:hypothetical protein